MGCQRELQMTSNLKRDNSFTDHISKILADTTLTLALILVIMVMVTVWYPWNPITKLRIKVLGVPVPGTTITVEVDYCKAREWVPAELRWSLLNDVVVILPASTASLPTGCHVVRILLPLPMHVVPGEYQLQEELTYRPWPWTAYEYLAQSPTFMIKGRE
jgi:hypothetical protein